MDSSSAPVACGCTRPTGTAAQSSSFNAANVTNLAPLYVACVAKFTLVGSQLPRRSDTDGHVERHREGDGPFHALAHQPLRHIGFTRGDLEE